MVAVVMGQFVELTPRGKTHYHEDLVVTQGGAAFDFSAGGGWTDFELEMKAKDDESGASIMTATVANTNAPGADGLLDLDVAEALTTAAQNATPPAPTLTRSQPAWLGFFIMFILVAAVLAVSLMPSKRSHQD